MEYIYPNVVDLAYQVIEMDDKIQRLERENEHLKALNGLLEESCQASVKHTNDMTAGMLLMAIGDDEGARKILTNKG